MQAVAQVGIGELVWTGPGVDAHAQVDVALADLDEIDARPQLARQCLGRLALDPDIGGKLDQRLGFESAHASGKAERPARDE